MTTIAPILVMLVIFVTLIGFAYAEDITNVEVVEYPFNITILEGGSMTLHNNGENTINFVSHGWFEGSVPPNDVIVLEFPIVNCGTTCFGEGIYYVNDLNGGDLSTITIEKPYVAPPVYVAPVYVEPTPEPVVAKPLEVVTTSTGINNVATYDGDVDAKALQIALADVTANFNKSVEKIAEQKTKIELLNANVTLLQVQQQVVTVDTTALDNKVLALQANNTSLANEITTIINDRDEWKALAENWYGVAMAQLKVMVNILGL